MGALQPFDDKYRQGAVLERKIAQEGIQRMPVHPMTDGGVDDPGGIALHLGDGHMDQVHLPLLSRRGGNGFIHGIRFYRIIGRNTDKDKVAGAQGFRTGRAAGQGGCQRKENKNLLHIYAKIRKFVQK